MMVPGLGNVPAMPSNAGNLIANATNEPFDVPPLPQGKTRSGPSSSQSGGPNYVDRRPQPRAGGKSDQNGSAEQILNSPNFNAKTFISKSLSGATDVEISAFADRLVSLQEKLVVDRKDMIYGNYKTFLTVGAQINVLSTELQSLRKLVNDFHVATTAIKEDAEQYLATSAADSAPRGMQDQNSMNHNRSPSLGNGLFPGRGLQVPNRQNNRNSVLMLEGMWQQDLNKLFKTVEGAQKYLPAAAGRHVLLESSGWYQLHAATWKPLQPIHVVLLSDHLLVASKKKHRNDTSLTVQPTQNLVADMCWPLTEIEIEDLSVSGPDGRSHNIPINRTQSPGQRLNGFMVVAGNMSFVYKTEVPDALSKLMSSYKRAIRELKGRPVSQRGHPHDHSKEEKKPGHTRHTSIDISERARNLREVDDLINDLDVKIAHRKFNEAVDIIQKNTRELGEVQNMSAAVVAAAQNSSATLAAGNTLTVPLQKIRKGSVAGPAPTVNTGVFTNIDIKTLRSQILKVKMDLRAKDVKDILLADLTQEFLGPSQTKNHIQLLIKLGQSEAVKKTFLGSRRQLISNRVKRIEFKGNIPAYIAQIATIHFRLIRTTVDIYQTCYPMKEYSSSIVEWAKAEVEDFVVMFARQLYNIDPSSEIYVKCANITREQSTQLKEVGLNLDFLLDYIYEGQTSQRK